MPICRNCGARIEKFNKDICPICGEKKPLEGVNSETVEITGQIDPNNKVLTKDGYKSIKKIRTEDLVMTNSGGFQKVTDTMISHINEGYLLETVTGNQVFIKPDQLIYARKNKIIYNSPHSFLAAGWCLIA